MIGLIKYTEYNIITMMIDRSIISEFISALLNSKFTFSCFKRVDVYNIGSSLILLSVLVKIKCKLTIILLLAIIRMLKTLCIKVYDTIVGLSVKKNGKLNIYNTFYYQYFHYMYTLFIYLI